MTIGDRFDAVMAGARRGEEPSVVALYQDVSPALMRYLKAREPQEAEDLCSEVWLQLARLIPSFEGTERQWWGLVFLVARRSLNDHWKRQRRRRTDPVDFDAFTDMASTVDVEESGIGAITTREALDFVTSALPPDQAEVILLRVVAGLGVEEVAAALERRPATVRVIQHRALRRLASRVGAAQRDRDAALTPVQTGPRPAPLQPQMATMTEHAEGPIR
jgi:RNA polymerase sigma-70 factor (ECF subfamily)